MGRVVAMALGTSALEDLYAKPQTLSAQRVRL